MTVLGMKSPQIQAYDSRSVQLFVEVHNPTSQSLNLKRLHYRLVSEAWFNGEGEVRVERIIAAGASAVVEILVPIKDESAAEKMQGAPYTLDAQLFTIANKTERSWNVRAKGALTNSRTGELQVAELP